MKKYKNDFLNPQNQKKIYSQVSNVGEIWIENSKFRGPLSIIRSENTTKSVSLKGKDNAKVPKQLQKHFENGIKLHFRSQKCPKMTNSNIKSWLNFTQKIRYSSFINL